MNPVAFEVRHATVNVLALLRQAQEIDWRKINRQQQHIKARLTLLAVLYFGFAAYLVVKTFLSIH